MAPASRIVVSAVAFACFVAAAVSESYRGALIGAGGVLLIAAAVIAKSRRGPPGGA